MGKMGKTSGGRVAVARIVVERLGELAGAEV
jgi:hypothetical protein